MPVSLAASEVPKEGSLICVDTGNFKQLSAIYRLTVLAICYGAFGASLESITLAG